MTYTTHWLSQRWPGFAVCAVVAVAARFVSEHHGAPVMLMALLLGMALNFLAVEGRCKAGVESTARGVLRVGVALLGLRITLEQVSTSLSKRFGGSDASSPRNWQSTA